MRRTIPEISPGGGFVVLVRGVVLGIAASLLPAAGATAAPAPPSCQGASATIVGSVDAEIEGTAGPDVIVSNGARVIRAGEGDDRICLTGRRKGRALTRVLAAGGDDRVTVDLDRPVGVSVKLGPGDDVFRGGPEVDIVEGELEGADDIRTGAGADVLRAYDSGPMDDRIDLGPGADLSVFSAGGVAEGARIDGAAGRDHLYLARSGDAEMVVDNAGGTLTLDDVPALRWQGFEELEVTGNVARLELVGGPRPETFVVPFYRLDEAHLGGGKDVLGFYVDGLAEGAVLDGGPGADHLAPTRTSGSASVDLTENTAHFSDPGVTVRVPGFENASVTARRVVLVGDQGRNRLAGYGCSTRVLGAGGPDVLAYARPYTTLFDCSIRTVLRGGAGDDLLLGGPRADLLYGNSGVDTARALGGKDLCRSVERKRGCERS